MRARVLLLCIAAAFAVVLLVLITKNPKINDQTKALNPVPSTANRLSNSAPLDSNFHCQDRLCCQFLATEDDRMRFEKCSKKVGAEDGTCTSVSNTELAGQCHFINGSGRAPVALASFPGSGNTWARGLLEKATGICTGALYCDNVLRTSGFTGEHIASGSVLVVKTHKTDHYWIGSPQTEETQVGFGRAILLIRNPIKAMVANYNRLMSQYVEPEDEYGSNNCHVSSVGQAHFSNSTKWNKYITRRLSRWMEHVTTWARLSSESSAHPVLVVLYEDLQADAVREVCRMLEFLALPCRMDELRHNLSEDFDAFHRKHTSDSFDPYTREQRGIVLNSIRKTLESVTEVTNGSTFGLDRYLK